MFSDQLDTDPWVLLAWRGRARDQILGGLSLSAAAPAARPPTNGLPPWWPLSSDGSKAADRTKPPMPATLQADPADRVLDRMGSFTSSVARPDIIEALRAAYDALRPGETGCDPA